MLGLSIRKYICALSVWVLCFASWQLLGTLGGKEMNGERWGGDILQQGEVGKGGGQDQWRLSPSDPEAPVLCHSSPDSTAAQGLPQNQAAQLQGTSLTQAKVTNFPFM